MAGGALPLIVNPAGPAPSSLLQSPFARANRSCSVNAGNLAFGNYNPLSGNTATTSAIFTVRCNRYTNVAITFSSGQSGTYTTRYMKAGSTDQLDYNIYTDTTYTGVIGDGTNGTYYYYGTAGPGGGYAYYYGLVPASQNVSPGSYSDIITVTVTY
ncbi:MAG: spore coat U domain-containing protein [Gammaproteobacteria bacterium]